jgi:TetR/AcrR family transcriptional regulator, transcriptional repressor for nem operon
MAVKTSLLKKYFNIPLAHIPTSMYLCAMNATDTRERILQQMFLDMRRNGFQGLRTDRVVSEMGITKGALYHYFPGKQAIGTAVLDEIIAPDYLYFYRQLDQFTGNPIPKLISHIEFLENLATDEDIVLGCPLNNLMQEMSPLDEEFRLRMKSIVGQIQQSVTAALERGKSAGFIRPDVDSAAVGGFFFGSIEGSYSVAKVHKSKALFCSNMSILKAYLGTLIT